MADLSGQRLGSYELTKKLGQGGMGAVYLGTHRTLQVNRAVKVLLPTEVDEGVVERFHREGQISASLRHPNIVQIFDVSEQDEVHYLVMELIDGVSLLQLLRSTGALPLERVVLLLRQVAAALDYAHARGVVHRDIKPSNIIVAPDDKVTLIDFGIARAMDESRLTRVGVVVGTFEYMAPEIVTEGGGSPNADRYALGIVAFQMLTGRVPFTGESAHSIMYRQVHDPPPRPSQFRPDLVGSAEDALLRQLAKTPDDRYPSALAFVDAMAASLHPKQFETQATALGDVTRPGFDRPTPGSGQTPLPRSGRVTRPVVTAATLTPPGVRALPSVPQAPPMTREGTRQATVVSGFAPRIPAPVSSAATVLPPQPKRNTGVIVGVAAVLVALLAIGVLLSPLRPAALDSLVGVTAPAPTAISKPAALAAPTTAPTTAPITAPTTAPTAPAAPAAPAVPPTAAAQPTVAQPPAVPPAAPAQPAAPAAPLTPNQKLAQARDSADDGDYPTAIKLLDELRDANPQPAGLDAATYDIRMAFAQALLSQNNPDGAYEQFGAALKVRPDDAAAKSGQDTIVLSKNYAIMEANWGKNDDAGIKALEDNMLINPDFRETRQKLYALLIMKADRQINAGEREAAFEVLMRALKILPDVGEAQKRLVSYTPTPMPTATPVPAPVYTAPAAQPASQPAPKPVAQPAAQPARQPAAQPAAQPRPASSGGGGGCPGGVCP